MFFSIIIPLYNKSALVKRAIDSVLLQQTSTNFEIIVVDDGSTDDSSKWVKQYTDIRVQYYYKENGGVSAARNYGIAKSKGEWVLFLDADDEFLDGAFNVFLAMIQKYPAQRIFVAAQRNGVPKTFSDDGCHLTNFPFWKLWNRMFYPRPGVLLVHKSVIDKLGGFDERMSFFEDYEFGLRMLSYGSVVYTGKAVVDYNQAQEGLSSKLLPINREMAYYIPTIIKKASFWKKMLLYENLLFTQSRRNSASDCEYYRQLEMKYFDYRHKCVYRICNKIFR